MPEWMKVLYMCYLGQNAWERLDYICEFWTLYSGQDFFDRYAVPENRIIKFLNAEGNGFDLRGEKWKSQV